MKRFEKAAIIEFAEEHSVDAEYLEELVRVMEDEGVQVDKSVLLDMLENGVD